MSIVSQTFADFELIICDNGSTDQTEKICREFAESDARIQYIRHPENLGAAENYNHAFSLAKGEYFKWAAHDDTYHPEYLDCLVRTLQENPDVVLAYPRTLIIDQTGEVQHGYLDEMASQSNNPVERMRKWMFPPRGQCNPVFGLIRRDVMAKTVLHGDYMGADRIFLADIAIRGKSICVPEGLFFRRVHSGMSTRANPDFLSLSHWFTGKRERGIRFKRWRQAGEFLRMIGLTDIPFTKKMGCALVTLKWMWAIRGIMLRELAVPLYVNGQKTRLGVFLLPKRKRKRRRRT